MAFDIEFSTKTNVTAIEWLLTINIIDFAKKDLVTHTETRKEPVKKRLFQDISNKYQIWKSETMFGGLERIQTTE